MDIKCEKWVYFKQNKKKTKNKLHLISGEHYKKKRAYRI